MDSSMSLAAGSVGEQEVIAAGGSVAGRKRPPSPPAHKEVANVSLSSDDGRVDAAATERKRYRGVGVEDEERMICGSTRNEYDEPRTAVNDGLDHAGADTRERGSQAPAQISGLPTSSGTVSTKDEMEGEIKADMDGKPGGSESTVTPHPLTSEYSDVLSSFLVTSFDGRAMLTLHGLKDGARRDDFPHSTRSESRFSDANHVPIVPQAAFIKVVRAKQKSIRRKMRAHDAKDRKRSRSAGGEDKERMISGCTEEYYESPIPVNDGLDYADTANGEMGIQAPAHVSGPHTALAVEVATKSEMEGEIDEAMDGISGGDEGTVTPHPLTSEYSDVLSSFLVTPFDGRAMFSLHMLKDGAQHDDELHPSMNECRKKCGSSVADHVPIVPQAAFIKVLRAKQTSIRRKKRTPEKSQAKGPPCLAHRSSVPPQGVSSLHTTEDQQRALYLQQLQNQWQQSQQIPLHTLQSLQQQNSFGFTHEQRNDAIPSMAAPASLDRLQQLNLLHRLQAIEQNSYNSIFPASALSHSGVQDAWMNNISMTHLDRNLALNASAREMMQAAHAQASNSGVPAPIQHYFANRVQNEGHHRDFQFRSHAGLSLGVDLPPQTFHAQSTYQTSYPPTVRPNFEQVSSHPEFLLNAIAQGNHGVSAPVASRPALFNNGHEFANTNGLCQANGNSTLPSSSTYGFSYNHALREYSQSCDGW
jgi:hypothetical protein